MRWSLWRRHATLWITVVILGFTTSVTGCGRREGSGAVAAHKDDAALVVDLPALYIDYDNTGTPYVGTVPLAAVGESFGLDLAFLQLDPTQLQRITEANIQHIQISMLPNQLLILVNGRVVPSLIWSVDALENARITLAKLLPPIAPVTPLLPVASEMGGGVTLRFPVAPGTAPIALTPATSEPGWQDDQAAYLAAVGAPPQLTIDVFYQDDGTWRVNGLDAAAWGESVPLPWARLNLDVADIQTLRAADIDQIVIASNREGIFLQINEQPLPHLSWPADELQNVLLLADEGGLFRQLFGDTPTAYSLAATLKRLLPVAQLTEVTLRVHFTATGAAP